MYKLEIFTLATVSTNKFFFINSEGDLDSIIQENLDLHSDSCYKFLEMCMAP